MLRGSLFLLLAVSTITSAHAVQVDTAWVRIYGGQADGSAEANAVVVDRHSNIYVTGHFENPGVFSDYLIIKYFADGDTAWVRGYNGPGSGDDIATSIAVNDSGNVWVTGYSRGANGLHDYATIKYYPDGDTAWIRRYDGPAQDFDWASQVVVDRTGNAYVTGFSWGNGKYDYATVKYCPNGDTGWVRRFDGGEGAWYYAIAVAVDSGGNVYVTGCGGTEPSQYDYLTIKYLSNGDTAWVRRYDGPGRGCDQAAALAIDSEGNVYIAGQSERITSGSDFATVKYDPDGRLLWVSRYGAGRYNDVSVAAMALNSAGDAYAFGGGYSNIEGRWKYVVLKQSSGGNVAWVRDYSEGTGYWSFPSAVTVDELGSAYVTGTIKQAEDQYYCLTLKYSFDGRREWEARYGLGTARDARSRAVAIDISGNVIVAGYSDMGSPNPSCTTIKYIQSEQCGDPNHDGIISIADVVFLANYLFDNGLPPDPVESGDVTCDGKINISDVVYLINYIFRSGPVPCKWCK